MRMWEIRENTGKYDSDYRMGMKDKDRKLQEAYDCGFEDGYKAAIEEIEESKMGNRSGYKDGDSSFREGYRRRR